MNIQRAVQESEMRALNQAKALSLFEKERAARLAPPAHTKHHTSYLHKTARAMVAEIEANQKTASSANLSFDSDSGSNLHVLLSEPGRRQIKLHLQEIDSRFETEIGKLYIEWKTAAARFRSQTLLNPAAAKLRLSKTSHTPKNNSNLFPGSTKDAAAAAAHKDSPELEVSQMLVHQSLLPGSTRNKSTSYQSVQSGEKPGQNGRYSTIGTKTYNRNKQQRLGPQRRVLRSTELLNKSTGNLRAAKIMAAAAGAKGKKTVNQSSMVRRPGAVDESLGEQRYERLSQDSLLRKVASNPDIRTEQSPIRVAEHYTPTKSGKKVTTSFTYSSTARRKKQQQRATSHHREDTPEPGEAPLPEPQPSLLTSRERKLREELENSEVSRSTENMPLSRSLAASPSRVEQQIREMSEWRVGGGGGGGSQDPLEASKMEQLILQIDRYTQRNNGRIPPSLREKLNSFSSEISRHFLKQAQRPKSAAKLNPNSSKLSSIKQKAQSRLKTTASSSRLPPPSTKSSPEPASPFQHRGGMEESASASKLQISSFGGGGSGEEQTFVELEAEFDKWLELVTSRRLKELAPCMKSHKMALQLGLCVMYLISDLDKTIILSPDKKKIAGKTWAHVQHYMNSSGKVVAQLKRLKAQLLLGPRINEALFRELKHYWGLCQTADQNDKVFFEQVYNFVRSAVRLVEFLGKTKIKNELQAKERRKTRSRSYGQMPRKPDSRTGSFLTDTGQRRKQQEAEARQEVLNELEKEEQKAEEEILEKQRQIDQARLKILELQGVRNKANWERERSVKLEMSRAKESQEEMERKYQDAQRRAMLEGKQEKEKQLEAEKREMMQNDIHQKRLERLRLVVQDKRETIDEFQKTVGSMLQEFQITEMEFKQRQKEEERKQKQMGHLELMERIEAEKKLRLEKFKNEAVRAKKERLERQRQEVEWEHQLILKKRADLEKELLLLSKLS